MARRIGSEARVAGTPADARAAGEIAELMAAWGLDVAVHEYDVLLPHARAARVDRIQPSPITLSMEEEPLPEQAASAVPWQR